MARPTPSQEARFRRLCGEHDAVSRLDVGGTTIGFEARDRAGRLELVELVEPDGSIVPLERALSILASRRRQALREGELAMRALIGHLALMTPDSEVNLTAIAAEADASKQTLYNRLRDVEVAR